MKYTSESINFLKKLKNKGNLSWNEISDRWNDKFANNLGAKSANSLRHVYRVYKDIEVTDELTQEPHPYAEFTKETLGEIIKSANIKNGIFFITAASPTNHLSEVELKPITKKRYEYALYVNKKNNKKLISVIEEDGSYFEEIRKNVFVPGFKTILNYCKKRSAELLILPMRAHVKALMEQPNHFDPILEPYRSHFVTEYTFNDYLMAFDAQLNPQQINPLTGLDRIRNKHSNKPNTSLIVAHTKQMYEPKASGNNTRPRVLYSTGCITKPEYLKNRIGRIAKEDHELGGLIVEVKNNKFFIRPVQFDLEGTIVDLGYRYYPTGKVRKERAEFINIGDEHAGHHTSEIRNVLHEILRELDPKAIGRNDIFDGASVNPHVKDDYYSAAKLPDHFKTIENELEVTKEVAFDVTPHIRKDCKILMLASNHHDFLERYLKSGRYLNDKVNYNIAHRMIVMKLDGKNPLKELIDPDDKLIWLDENEDYYIEGYQVNAHGHKGPDGARGSNVNLEKGYGKVLKAHDHKIVKRYGLFSCGHFSTDRHGYNKGPSTWLPGVGVIYKGGSVQTITVIDGEWKL